MAERRSASDESGRLDEAVADARDDAELVAALVVRARLGDERALARIVDLCTPMVRGLASRYLHDPCEVDDVVQEVWLRFTEHLHRIESLTSTRGWLARVTTHAAWRAQRRATRTTPTGEIGEWAASDDTAESGLDRADKDERWRIVRAALARLAPRERRLIELLVADERPSYQLVATRVGRPIGSIGPTRQRILAQLRRELAPASTDPVADLVEVRRGA